MMDIRKDQKTEIADKGHILLQNKLRLEQKLTEVNTKKNRLQAEVDNFGRENLNLKKELRRVNESLKDLSALLDDKRKLDVYSENKRLKQEIVLNNIKLEWKDHEVAKDEDGDSWQMSYADMVTLLLVFFVFFYSFSAADWEKFRMATDSFVRTFKANPLSLEQKEGSPEFATEKESEKRDEFLGKMKSEMEDLIREENLQENIDIVWTGGELVIAVKARIFFPSGEADLTEEAKRLLKEMARILKSAPKILVEGHTDDLPIHTEKFPSNWELSSARACRVVRFFIQEGEVPPEKLTAVGLAHYIPLVPNDSEDNRASNRRVEIKIRHRKFKE